MLKSCNAFDFSLVLPKPVRHFIAASSSELTAFISRDGYWNCLNIFLGLEAGKNKRIVEKSIEFLCKLKKDAQK